MFDDLGGSATRKEWSTRHPRLEMDYFGEARLPRMMAEARAQGTELQRSRLDLVTRVVIGKASIHDPVTIYVSLEGSEISSGQMLWNSPWRKGYFQTRVGVGLYLTNDRGERRVDFSRVADGPDPVEGTEETLSKVDFDFARSRNIEDAFFDIDSGLAVDSGVPIEARAARTVSADLSGFRVANSHPRHGARHEYIMSATSGGAYDTPRDMVLPHSETGLFDFMTGASLHTPPSCARDGLPLISQCAWQSDQVQSMGETVYLNIDVTQTVMRIASDSARAGGHPDAETIKLNYRVEESIPLGHLFSI